MLAAAEASAPSAREVWQPGDHALLEAAPEEGIGAIEGIRRAPGDVEAQIEGQQLEVGQGHVAHQGEEHPAAPLLGREQFGAGRLVRAPDASPHVDLPRGGQAPEEQVVGTALRPIQLGNELEHAAVALHAYLVIHPGKELGARHAGQGARLLHPRHRDAQVVVAAQRPADQVLEGGIVEDLPPRQVGERGARRLIPPRPGSATGAATSGRR